MLSPLPHLGKATSQACYGGSSSNPPIHSSTHGIVNAYEGDSISKGLLRGHAAP